MSQEQWDSACGSVPEALRIVNAAGAALARYSNFADSTTKAILRTEVEQHTKRRGASTAWAAMEDATAAVLREFGYDVRSTARSKDGGVDVIADHLSTGTVFVQVKHSKNRVGVRTVRELIGTMCINGVNDGLLVSSSEFTQDAYDEASAGKAAGKLVELIDGGKFIAALDLTERTNPPSLADVTSFAKITMNLVYEAHSL